MEGGLRGGDPSGPHLPHSCRCCSWPGMQTPGPGTHLMQRYDPEWQDIIILGGVGGDSGKLGCPHRAAPRSWLCGEGHPCEEGCASEHAGQGGFMRVSTSVHTPGHASFPTCLSQSMPTPRSRAPQSGDSLRLFSVSQSKVLSGSVPHS